ncbi:substrate-binding domain-containing protein [Clostridium grantii]|uniref:Transcriptional regulator, LacI family n=1 Tax=Clostridium grantii DSM 8605 TaxID=1121316 RepID=A0A1M5QG99_9CLOT|nr:substrate-binding domain-containing protein [Clostridium grantii]SHH12779.1 transcriptional regulator, LacI family [Clostridium grantii DSM 8605]
MKHAKLIDVADKAGVSISTVSQYLSGRYKYMSKDTKERIRLTIEELNYIPNSIARSLKTDVTKTIGVIVFDMAGYFTSSVLRGIDDYCKKSNYNVIIYNTDYDAEIEKKSINMLKMLRVDGIIIASSGKNNKLLDEENKNGTCIVQVFMEYDDLDISTVLSDYKGSTFNATEYLIKLGHKKIALITQEYEHIPSRQDRILGYEEAMIKNGIALNLNFINIWDRFSDLNKTFDEALKSENSPTAIFSMHSSVTAELLNYCNMNKINVPEDLSIIGFDELPLANLFKTPITVVDQKPYEIGQKAAELVLWKINHKKERENNKVIVSCELKIRESCKSLDK